MTMSFAYAHIAQRVFNTPLLYDDRKAEAFVLGLGGRISGGPVIVTNGGNAVDHTAFENGRASAGRIGNYIDRVYSRANQLPFDVVDNVAIIAIEGSLVHKGTFVGQSDSGDTSYEGLMAQIGMATKSPQVKGVVFEVDSFGGEVSGAYETAAMIAQLSKVKPTIAILTDFAYSAAYLLASQTRQIIAPEFGGAGSIGTIMLHADNSGYYEQQGVKITIIRAGKRKAEGNSLEPLPKDVEEKWQAQAEQMRERFAEFVGRGRGARFSKAKALKTEAEAFDAKESLALGIIDAIADPAQTFDAFVKEINRI
jgi:signal peptide peptidase SppA